jgi:protein-tyrosine phosphatase
VLKTLIAREWDVVVFCLDAPHMRRRMAAVLGDLVVCGFEESFDSRVLEENRVTHILNVASECASTGRLGLAYLELGVPDDCPDADIRDVLPGCLRFIGDAVAGGGAVMVHCLEGRSRSVCVALAYMTAALGWDFDAALARVRSERPTADPWPRYLEQTREWGLANIR